jgi:hypothetical protein
VFNVLVHDRPLGVPGLADSLREADRAARLAKRIAGSGRRTVVEVHDEDSGKTIFYTSSRCEEGERGEDREDG